MLKSRTHRSAVSCNQMHKRVCIIGAGSSGLTTIKALKEAGIPFDCFEMGSDIGGNWRYNNDNGRSAAYDSLHIDTSKERMAFSDFPMPADYPPYPHHSQIFAYFRAYAKQFDLYHHITFQTQVTQVAPAAAGGYDVIIRNIDSGQSETHQYRAVLVCNGHHWQPKLPRFPGHFSGECLHSRTYRKPEPWAEQRVLVVGIGNSGVDIACDLAQTAAQVYLSTRRGAHILPRYIWDRPTDTWVKPWVSRLPISWQSFLLTKLIELTRGNQESFGIPKPDHDLPAQHPTMSQDLPELVQNGRIHLKPNISRLDGRTVHFTDSSRETIDTIIFATGYKISFPFFDPDFIDVRDNDLPLYRKVIHPEHEGLYFIGLIQPLGAIMPLAELQAKWVTDLLCGQATLPPKAHMWQAIVQEQAGLRRRYVHSTRHTIQVDFFPYKRQIEQEIAAGRQLARTKVL